MTNFRIAIKIHKHVLKDSASNYFVVEYGSSEEAKKAIDTEHILKGVVLEKDYARSSKDSKKGKKGAQNFKTKVYLGNLAESFTDSDLEKMIEGKIEPVSMFVSKSLTEKQKKYAFLEFSNETDRNVALGTLEGMKQKGGMDDDIIISPAYPSGAPSYKRAQSRTV